jgi:hypothetical protein
LIIFQRDAAKLLADVLDALAVVQDSSRQQKQQLESLVWLLHAVPGAAKTSAFDQLRTPLVPQGIANQLVAAGMRISYEQLLTAAHSRVPGVEVWVQAQQQLGVQSNIPAVAVAICCNEDLVSIINI